jgi:hypothetical protein
MKRLLVLALAVTGILAAGCIVRLGTFDRDTNHFVGLASNLTNVDVVSASVQVDFLNSSGTIVDTENVDTCTRTLQKHMDSPIEATSDTNARTVKTTVHPQTFGHKDVADIDEVDENDVDIPDPTGDTLHIKGPITANEDLEDVHVCAAVFDNDGIVLAVGEDDNVGDADGNIDDGDTANFDVSVDISDLTAEDADHNVGDIDSYELWIDARSGSDVTAPAVVGPNDVNVEEATPTPTGTPPTATPTRTSTPTMTPTPP